MDMRFELNGAMFVWNEAKAAANPRRHESVTFEQAVTVLFYPFFGLVDASRHDESRDAAIGFDAGGWLLSVVHVERNDETIRIVPARKTTRREHAEHDS